jgi:hypothetical protein
MGFMDKVKAQAEKGLEKGKVAAEKGLEKSKEGIAQGQAKVKEMQDKRTEDKGKGPDAPAGNYSLDDV